MVVREPHYTLIMGAFKLRSIYASSLVKYIDSVERALKYWTEVLKIERIFRKKKHWMYRHAWDKVKVDLLIDRVILPKCEIKHDYALLLWANKYFLRSFDY